MDAAYYREYGLIFLKAGSGTGRHNLGGPLRGMQRTTASFTMRVLRRLNWKAGSIRWH